MMETHPPHLKNKFLQLRHQTLHVCVNHALFSFVHVISLACKSFQVEALEIQASFD
jgi:hypothetical protein